MGEGGERENILVFAEHRGQKMQKKDKISNPNRIISPYISLQQRFDSEEICSLHVVISCYKKVMTE